MEVELEVELEVGDDLIVALATFEVTGEYRPATWGYDGGDPPEYPEANLLSLTHDGRRLPTSLLGEEEHERLATLAVGEATEEDGPDPD